MMNKSVIFDETQKFRYVLFRDWDTTKPIALCIGLNPSKADSKKDDPTIAWLIKSLRSLGFGGLRMMNLYALISSQPHKLFETCDAIKDNNFWFDHISKDCNEIIFCWGSFMKIEYRAQQIQKKFIDRQPKCFGKNKNGSPWHPLGMMYAGLKPEQATLTKF
ncbi:hypothetical protein WSM22_03210 [Cytophagales bacterium WSM2-2]|nr:hypothetical protein WSM22_03210 [Cytophagales bacterium WSM2-2]